MNQTFYSVHTHITSKNEWIPSLTTIPSICPLWSFHSRHWLCNSAYRNRTSVLAYTFDRIRKTDTWWGLLWDLRSAHCCGQGCRRPCTTGLWTDPQYCCCVPRMDEWRPNETYHQKGLFADLGDKRRPALVPLCEGLILLDCVVSINLDSIVAFQGTHTSPSIRGVQNNLFEGKPMEEKRWGLRGTEKRTIDRKPSSGRERYAFCCPSSGSTTEDRDSACCMATETMRRRRSTLLRRSPRSRDILLPYSLCVLWRWSRSELCVLLTENPWISLIILKIYPIWTEFILFLVRCFISKLCGKLPLAPNSFLSLSFPSHTPSHCSSTH